MNFTLGQKESKNIKGAIVKGGGINRLEVLVGSKDGWIWARRWGGGEIGGWGQRVGFIKLRL